MSYPASLPHLSGKESSNAPANASTLDARGVGYCVGGRRSLLDGASVRLEPGRLLAVIGPNGAGKSTLLRLLAGELTATTGEIRLDGRPLAQWPANLRARRIAVLPQQSTLHAALTGLEVVLLGRSSHPSQGVGPADLLIAREVLEIMDAGHLAARLYPSLSGGEKSRLQAARVLAQIWEPPGAMSRSDPGLGTRFLLLDEPTAALDCAHQHQLLSRVRQIAVRQRIGVLAVLHDLNLAAQYADDMLALKDGRPVSCGHTKTVFREDVLTKTFDMNWLVLPHPVHDWLLAVPALRNCGGEAVGRR